MVNKIKVYDEEIGWWTYDLTNNEIFWSDLTKKIHEVDNSYVPNLNSLFDFYDKDFKKELIELINQLKERQTPYILDCHIVTSNGTDKWVRSSGAVAEIKNGKVSKITGTIREISKEVNSSIKDHQLVAALNDLAIISATDKSGNITFVNELFIKISGFSKDELIGKSHRILKSGHHPDEFFKTLWDTILRGDSFHGEVVNKKKNGEIYWVEAHIYPIKNLKGEIIEFISIRFDITDKTLKQNKEIRMAKFEMVGETSAQIMHDVMNPLSIIHGTLEILQKKLIKTIAQNTEINKEDLDKNLTNMLKASIRIRDIFKNMKDLMADKVSVEDADLIQIIIESINNTKNKITQNHVEVTFENENNLPIFATVNRAQLIQVFINMIGNSCDAISDLEEKWIKIKIVTDNDLCVISIIDSGKGIPKELHKKIFESLYTSKSPDKGTGLGLSICKRIIGHFNGKIEVNPESLNTQFDITLPIIQ
jgi:PAS domain S-box-containing protein